MQEITGNQRIVVIDNYDSFVYNLVQYLGEAGATPIIHRNNKVTTDQVLAMDPDAILISPGPGIPSQAGITNELVRRAAESGIFVFGVCLGHQAIGEVFGSRVVRAPYLMHGKTSMIKHDGKGVFMGLPNPFRATRYHSLIVEKETLSEDLQISATSEDGLIMGLRHKTLPVEGVQFHPESIYTDSGKMIIRNFLDLARAATSERPRRS
ncbi:MAG: aminodeoxychorismate/anthranilate synthase component II [Actinomycetota bacterium]|nr:aminodeoxychorismate/anthranilate synthase component II [Actinomycetota bacterium]